MPTPRIALVLGAGGTVGHAYHAGVLSTLHHELGWDGGAAELMVGTSAGSVVAALLRAGLPAADLARRASGEELTAEGSAVIERARLTPPRSSSSARLRTGSMSSPARLARAVRAPWEIRPGSLAAAVMPAGRNPTDHIAAPFDTLYGGSWPSRPLWIVAVELDTGRRVAFGRDGAPPATPAQAVQASCSIPAYFEPTTIGGSRYVDGGVHSTTNADLVAAEEPDLVVISAPMSAARGAAKFGPGLAMRQIARLSLAREVTRLRSRGVTVVTFQPTTADLDVMGSDALDPTRTGPVCEQVRASTRRRLARPEVRTRLAALAATA